MILGGSAFFARRNTVYRQKKIQPQPLLRISAFTELNGYGHVTLYAHRGLSGTAPENTPEAIRAAGEAGFTNVQLDVAVSADDGFVLFHDETLERMTAEAGRLSFCSTELLRRTPLDNGANIEEYGKLYIPTLREALGLCRTYGLRPVLNIRAMDLQRLTALHTLLRGVGSYALCAADARTLTAYRTLDADCALQYRVGEITEKDIRMAKENGWLLVFDCTKNREEVVREAAGRTALCAETVNTRDTLAQMVRAGVTQIVTDCILPPVQK